MNKLHAILIVNVFLAGPAWDGLAQGQPQASKWITKVYEIKWRRAEDMATLLETLPGPTARGTLPTEVSEAFNTITVSASSEEHGTIQELLQKHDIPPKRVLFEFYILGASRDGEGTKNGLPAPIREVVEDISSLTKYRQFEVLGSPVITVSEGGGDPRSLTTKGQFALEIDGIRVVPVADRTSIVVDRFRFGAADRKIGGKELVSLIAMNKAHAALPAYSTASLVTPIVAASGETLVIGTSHVSDASELGDAVIIVVTPRVLE